MRNYILNNIKEGLENAIGASSSYGNTLVESVVNRIPDRVTVNRFTGISMVNVTSFDREIGKSYPVRKNYNCLIAVLVKNADFNLGQNEVDIIGNRIFKYFANDTGSLKGLSLTRDGVKEEVISYQINNVDYGEAGELTVGEMGNACLISVEILIEVTI